MIQDRFAAYIVSLAEAELPDEVIVAAKRVVVDWFAALLPGGRIAPATLLIEALGADEIGHGGAVLYPSGLRAPPRTAALINGAASHTIEFDDIYRDGLYHPGTVVIPAALAAAQSRGANGTSFLRAVVAGYEVSNRIAASVNPAHYAYWHTTGTVGHFGAAAAVSSILGLDETKSAHALATAATMAAGLQQAFRADAMSKPLHAGQAAANGALAAISAEAGITGAADMFEGKRGFGAAMGGNPDWTAATADLGREFTILETTQKNHAACGHIHAAIDAILTLRARHGIEAGDVERIKVATYGAALEITGNAEPTTEFECKFSTPYCLAVAFLTGRVRVEAFDAHWRDDPVLRDLMRRVEMRLDPEAEVAFPHLRGGVVEIETKSGEHFSEHSPTRKGDPDNPLSHQELTGKYRELVGPVIGRDAGERLLDALWQVDRIADMSELPFAPPGPAAVRAQGG